MNSAQVKKISNGYVVTTYANSPPPALSGAVETYCSDLDIVAALLEDTFEPGPASL